VSATRRIPILDLAPEAEALWPQLSEKLKEVIFSGAFIGGPETVAFEKESASYLGVRHAVGLNSGTDALIIALRAAGVEPGDEVITSPFSFFATAESISIIGAKPVFVDVELDSMNLDPSLIEAAITERTKAVMPVHLFGRPAAMGQIMAIAQEHGLKVIEDCAQSFGARYEGCPGCPSLGKEPCASHQGKMTGAMGESGCFSFYPTKNLGAYGDGGLLVTDSDEVAETARKLRNHGSIKRYHNEVLGYNSRLDSIQAAILRIKLPLIDSYNQARRRIAQVYGSLLADVEGIIAPEVTPGHVFHQYTIRILGGKRDAIAEKLTLAGVGNMIYYPIPQDRLPVYEGQHPRCPLSDALAEEVLSLPIWPQMDEETQARVAQALREAATD
jgi:dTDP-4-amino-4,6-dideoxygalactose transaminase